MRHSIGRAVAIGTMVAALCVLAPRVPLVAQERVRVEEIRLDPDEHRNEIRSVDGIVERLVSRATDQEPAFYLEDDFGHQILVIPFGEAPSRGDRLTVTGVVSLDAAGDPVLTVFDEAGLVGIGAGEAPLDGPSISSAPEFELPPNPAENRRSMSPLLVGSILLMVAALVALAFQRGRASAAPDIIRGPPPEKKKDEVDIAVSALWPESDQEFDGRTMRFLRPDPTVRLMSAKLEVIGGADAGEEIRFVGVPGDGVTMMFGRSPGEGPSNVQLKQKTVSRTHAVMRHRHGEWLIENLSMTNPTVLNGEILGVKERLLTEGDRIEMGEVTFRFRE